MKIRLQWRLLVLALLIGGNNCAAMAAGPLLTQPQVRKGDAFPLVMEMIASISGDTSGIVDAQGRGIDEREFQARLLAFIQQCQQAGSAVPQQLFLTDAQFASLRQLAGTLTHETVSQLRADRDARRGSMQGGGSIELLFGMGDDFAVQALQADPNNNDAVFQMASKFHALEANLMPQKARQGQLEDRGNNGSLDNKNFLTGSFSGGAHRAVQGENAMFSAAAGGIWKLYFADLFNHLAQVPRAAGLQFNEYGDLADARLVAAAVQGLQLNDSTAIDDIVRNIEIPFLEGTHVILGKSTFLTHGQRVSELHDVVLPAAQQCVNQVACAALNLKPFGASKNPTNTTAVQPGVKAFARAILNGMYEGTLRSAFLHGKKKVFLTLVGGSDFCNEMDWILGAIERMGEFIYDAGLEVKVVTFTDRDRYWDSVIASFNDTMASAADSFSQRQQDGQLGRVEVGLVTATAGEPPLLTAADVLGDLVFDDLPQGSRIELHDFGVDGYTFEEGVWVAVEPRGDGALPIKKPVHFYSTANQGDSLQWHCRLLPQGLVCDHKFAILDCRGDDLVQYQFINGVLRQWFPSRLPRGFEFDGGWLPEIRHDKLWINDVVGPVYAPQIIAPPPQIEDQQVVAAPLIVAPPPPPLDEIVEVVDVQ